MSDYEIVLRIMQVLFPLMGMTILVVLVLFFLFSDVLEKALETKYKPGICSNSVTDSLDYLKKSQKGGLHICGHGLGSNIKEKRESRQS